MNISDKLPIKFIKWCMDNDVPLTLEKDYIDLDTGMKSHLHLYYEDGNYVAKMRYGEEVNILYFSCLHSAIRDCEHGRGFMASRIEKLYNEGFGDIEYDDFE